MSTAGAAFAEFCREQNKLGKLATGRQYSDAKGTHKDSGGTTAYKAFLNGMVERRMSDHVQNPRWLYAVNEYEHLLGEVAEEEPEEKESPEILIAARNRFFTMQLRVE